MCQRLHVFQFGSLWIWLFGSFISPPLFFFSILFRQSLGGIVKGFIFFFLTCFLTILCFYKNSWWIEADARERDQTERVMEKRSGGGRSWKRARERADIEKERKLSQRETIRRSGETAWHKDRQRWENEEESSVFPQTPWGQTAMSVCACTHSLSHTHTHMHQLSHFRTPLGKRHPAEGVSCPVTLADTPVWPLPSEGRSSVSKMTEPRLPDRLRTSNCAEQRRHGCPGRLSLTIISFLTRLWSLPLPQQ